MQVVFGINPNPIHLVICELDFVGLSPAVAHVLARSEHSYSVSLLHTGWPLCAGKDEICMHVKVDYTCRLWEPGPLRSPFSVWAPNQRLLLLLLLSGSYFKHILQLNWLRIPLLPKKNQRLNS